MNVPSILVEFSSEKYWYNLLCSPVINIQANKSGFIIYALYISNFKLESPVFFLKTSEYLLLEIVARLFIRTTTYPK